MTLYPGLRDSYGEFRGWRRATIRRETAGNAARPADEIGEHTRGLFAKRVVGAVQRFPLFADRVRAHRGRIPVEDEKLGLAELPIWTREDQRQLFASIKGPPVPGSFVHSTGGSTGVPLRFYVTRESFEWRTAVSDRGYSWAEAEEGRRSFYVWGTPIKDPGPLTKAKAALHHWLQRRVYFDSFHFGDEQKRQCCARINRVRPHALVGYAGNLIELAWFVRDNPDALTWRSRTVVTAAEGLAPGRREMLEEHLGDEVFMSYGSREFMMIGMECSRHTGYHIASDNLFVEVVDEAGQPCPPGVTGRILITDLHNAANPFIRYEIGDVGAMAGVPCPCGLPFPLLARVEGRLQEVIVKPGGERLTALFIPHLMKEFPWVEGYQIAQEDPASLSVRLVTGRDPTPEMTRPIASALREKVGAEMKIGFERVQALTKSPSGKTPIVISRMSRGGG